MEINNCSKANALTHKIPLNQNIKREYSKKYQFDK